MFGRKSGQGGEFRLDVLVTKEKNYYSAHCLQFDLVATDDTQEGAEKAIADLCLAHIHSSIENDNLEYMFSPAPKEVWARYFYLLERKECLAKQEYLRKNAPVLSMQSCYA